MEVKNTVAPAPMGRPPKNMCTNCRGFGEKFHATFSIEYYGNGEEVRRKQIAPLHGKTCRSCGGSGIKGGKLREGEAPILEMLKTEIEEPETKSNGSGASVQEADEELPV